jgi:fused signal recognition particle receptor
VVEREAGGIDEVLLVLDATAGQNGIVQVKEFSKAVGVTGIILTKLDGTSRGGIVVAVEEELSVPVKFAGVGEGLDDLVPFAPSDFIDELLAEA